MFKVESGIPMPTPTYGGGANVYPWNDMGIGDSFFVATDGSKRANSRVGSAASQRSRRVGHRFAVRTVEGGVRVWRVE
jgi:hypothetical protein